LPLLALLELVWTHHAAGDPPRIFQERQGTDRQNQPIRPALQPQLKALCMDRYRKFHLPKALQTMPTYFWDGTLDHAQF